MYVGAKIIFAAIACVATLPGVQPFDISLGDITEVMNFAREAVTGTLESLEWIKKGNLDDQHYDFPFVKKMERRLMDGISKVDHKIELFEERAEVHSQERLDKLMSALPLQNKLDLRLHQMGGHLARIEELYNDFIEFKQSDQFERYTLEEFAQTSVSTAVGALPDMLKDLHRLVVPGQFSNYDNSILVLLAQSTKEVEKQICSENQSPQQLLYNLYNTIAITEMKGYAMMQFSYTLLRLYNNGTFDEEIKRTDSKYLERTSETLRAVQTAMSFAPRELWRCDPGVHKEGTTYAELKQLFQGYIVNEVDLNPTSTCKENCAYYSLATVNGCYDNQYCSQQRRCAGKVLNCRYIDSDMWICPSARNADRRYEYIQYENGQVYGKTATCKRPTSKVDSWWRWLFWHCSYCMCTCDEQSNKSDRYFSLREVTSDVQDNMVVTGLSLTKENKIVHLVIQQGKLMKRGTIDEASVSWKKVDNFTIFSHNVQNGRDYHTLAWEKRALDLDDLMGPESHVLTGVRFRMVGTHLNFEIRVTPFNFTTGKLLKPLEMSRWLSNDNTDASEKARIELKLNKPGVPSESRAPSLPDSRSNQYINFVPTDQEKDAAQSTVPFLDIQPVETIPPFPLSGAGIYHKGRDGSGGFLAPRIVTYDFKMNLRPNVPPPRPVIGVNEIPTF